MDHLVVADLVHRWDAQQERYAHRRPERLEAMVALVHRATEGIAAPLVLDIGSGPGSLAAMVADTIPHARVVGFECDPVLVTLSRAWCGDRVEVVERVVGTPGWDSGLPEGRVDAVVSSSALHYPAPAELSAIYADAYRLLRPGGLLVNGDDFAPPGHVVGADQVAHLEPWRAWWRSAATTSALAEAFARRDGAVVDSEDNGLSAQAHLDLMSASGFVGQGVVWSRPPSTVLSAWRSTPQGDAGCR